MTTFDRPASGIRGVYGRSKGLVARRKALLSKATKIITISDSSSSESEDNDDEEKENEEPKIILDGRLSNNLKSIKQFKAPAIPISKFYSSESEEEEIVKPSRWRLNKSPKKTTKREVEPSTREIDAESEDDLDDLVVLMGNNLRVASTSKGSRKEIEDKPAKGSNCEDLLTLCGQERPKNFSEFLDELQQRAGCDNWKKFGEASYSEVYGLITSNSVVKIIPLLDNVDEIDKSVPDCSLASDVHREVEMTRSLAKVSDGFVKMYSAQIVQGVYPSRLLQARANRKTQSEESKTSPESFYPHQKYAALVLKNSGEDLESYDDLTWRQAASIFCQVVKTLSQGEETLQFEHRDLHWGNVVIASVDMEELCDASPLIKGKEVEQFGDSLQCGVKATIIDYTLSRATIGKTLIAYAFEDESLFEGHGDMQFDIYRQMRLETDNNWSDFYPHTNVLWLNYLASKLIDEKHIPNPKRRSLLDPRSSEELQCRNFLMQAKQLLLSKRIESAAQLYDQLSAIQL